MEGDDVETLRNEEDTRRKSSIGGEEDVKNWYESTFSAELRHLDQAKEFDVGDDVLGAAEKLLGGRESTGVVDQDEHEEESNARRLSGEVTLASLQQSLQDAIDYAHKEAREKLALQRRLTALEKLENLRLDASNTPEKTHRGSLSLAHGVTQVQPWDRDEDFNECFSCGNTFSFTNRRHHCRNCGHIFCENCAPSKSRAPIPHMGFQNPVRHCNSCMSLRARQAKTTTNNTLPTSPKSGPMSNAVVQRLQTTHRSNSTFSAMEQGNTETFSDIPPGSRSPSILGTPQTGGRRHSSKFVRSQAQATDSQRPSTAPSSSSSGSATDYTSTPQSGRPPGAWIDYLRAMEIKASANPTTEAILGVVELYRSAIEELSGAETDELGTVSERREGSNGGLVLTSAQVQTSQFSRTRHVLVENMHSFLELPHVKACLTITAGSVSAKKVVSTEGVNDSEDISVVIDNSGEEHGKIGAVIDNSEVEEDKHDNSIIRANELENELE